MHRRHQKPARVFLALYRDGHELPDPIAAADEVTALRGALASVGVTVAPLSKSGAYAWAKREGGAVARY